MPVWLIRLATTLTEVGASILRARSPLTRDFVDIGRVSYVGDTTRMRGTLGELIFAGYGSLEHGREQYAGLKEAAAAEDRDPDQMKITTLAYPMVVTTHDEAVEKKAAYDELPNDID